MHLFTLLGASLHNLSPKGELKTFCNDYVSQIMTAMLLSFLFAFESVPDRYFGLNLCLLQFCNSKELRHLINITLLETFVLHKICTV